MKKTNNNLENDFEDFYAFVMGSKLDPIYDVNLTDCFMFIINKVNEFGYDITNNQAEYIYNTLKDNKRNYLKCNFGDIIKVSYSILPLNDNYIEKLNIRSDINYMDEINVENKEILQFLINIRNRVYKKEKDTSLNELYKLYQFFKEIF